jgi:hypothetical protein
MGSSPSKAERRATIDSNQSKDSKSDTAPSSFESQDDDSMPREKIEPSMSTSATPRTKQNKSGFDAQNRVDRQLAGKNGSDRRDDVTARAHNRDNQVHVNLAMADLMAYLQVVANNSNNLPLTKRDDPELGRMISNLTSEEYARKSAAFIPADVRVIGGSFLKYGRVWDLPTGEEYNASDGAQEPGEYFEDLKNLSAGISLTSIDVQVARMVELATTQY